MLTKEDFFSAEKLADDMPSFAGKRFSPKTYKICYDKKFASTRKRLNAKNLANVNVNLKYNSIYISINTSV